MDNSLLSMVSSTSSSSDDRSPRLPETLSTCVTASVAASHNFEMTRYSLLEGMGVGKFVTSGTFSVDGHDWNIRVYPDGWKEEQNAAGYVSVFLCLCGGATGARAKYTLSLLENGGGASEGWSLTHRFDNVGAFWGFPRFTEKSKLRQWLLRRGGDYGDCVTIRCALTVIREPRTEDVTAVAVPPSDMTRFLATMLRDGDGADVVVVVRDQLFRAHGCILAARSPVFWAELIYGGHVKERRTSCIVIDGMDPSIFPAFLHFIYTDSLPDSFDTPDQDYTAVQHLTVAADRYGLERLVLICEEKLCRSIDVQTVATTLALAEQHQRELLKNACLGFMVSRDVLGAIAKTDGFKHLIKTYPSIMVDILDKVASVMSKE